MKPTSFIVNFSRGSVIDTEALVLSLKLKQIAGAALDVYEIEPLPLDHELYKLNNVLLFPHFGTMTKDAEEKTAVVLSKRIIKALSMNWYKSHLYFSRYKLEDKVSFSSIKSFLGELLLFWVSTLYKEVFSIKIYYFT